MTGQPRTSPSQNDRGHVTLDQYGSDDLEIASASSVLNGFRLSIRIMPAFHATRGGDWCETFTVLDRVVALSIGDVCGHGPDAFDAMLTTRRAVKLLRTSIAPFAEGSRTRR
jgi:hypothetical protein